MENKLSNNKKTKMVAAVVSDQMDYVKKSKSYLPESELKNKKYGRTYTVYIPDPGKVKDGLVAEPDAIEEVEMSIKLENKNTSCEIDAWNELTDIEDFKKEIAIPRGTKLAKSVQKEVIDSTVFQSVQATVATAANFAALSDVSNKLEEVAVGGVKVMFNSPTVNGKIAAAGLSNFIPDTIQKDIYGKNYLGEYANASQISLAGLPIVTAGASACSISGTAISGEDTLSGTVVGYEPITAVTCAGGKKGEAFSVAGLKVVDVNGMPTDQDYTVILASDADNSNKCAIAPIRATLNATVSGVKVDNVGNPNAWFDTTFNGFSATPLLTSGSSYYVGVCREEDALAFDTYKFSDLPGSENSTETVDGVSVKMSEYGDGLNMKSFVRLDCPFAAGVPDARRQAVLYVKK
jgi:hypothetical protein